ncbi:MAG: glutamate synthase subunit beta [Kiritimatiellae bacterium]|nr:glutamate synthase subunit beta [Kiritimatiellia bacterium]
MTKQLGFLEERKEAGYRPVGIRLLDFEPVEQDLTHEQVREQTARCMECGTPFCHGYGCPLSNAIPECNELVYQGRWSDALELLLATNPFPEFTGRICPAPCETSCVAGLGGEAVTIRQMERAVMDYGYENGLLGMPPSMRRDELVAVIGSGPAGLAAAEMLNRAGYRVTVYDEAKRPGGILRYGIPNFKLDKQVVDRRIRLMEQEGIAFECGVRVGEDVSYHYLKDRYDAICLCCGSRAPRDMKVPGRENKGIHFAMDFLMQQNRRDDGEEIPPEQEISAAGKHVVVIGGGDTGSDCLGTSLRQGAASVMQLEIMPRPPAERAEDNPWPEWPRTNRESSSHKEGGERRWCVNTRQFRGKEGQVTGLQCVEVEWVKENGRFQMVEKKGTEFELEADLVLLAMGFVGPGENKLADVLGLTKDARGNIQVNANHQTSVPDLFAAGDMVSGQSLVVRAIADGMETAKGIQRVLEQKAGDVPSSPASP